MFETLHSEHKAKRRFLMAHPTSLWRLSWRVVLFCALVARIIADLLAARQEAACAKDALLKQCVERPEPSALPAASDWCMLGLAVLEIALNVRTGSIDARGHFDMRPREAWRKYRRSGQLLVDVCLLPPWRLFGAWLAPPPPRRKAPPIDGRVWLRAASWLRSAPPVDGAVRWWRGAGDARTLLAAEPPAVVKRALDDYVVPWLLGHGLERYVSFARRLPDIGDLAFEYRVLRRAAYSILTSLKLVLLALAVRRVHRERLLLFDALRSRAAHRIYSALRLNAAKRRYARASQRKLATSVSFASLASFDSLVYGQNDRPASDDDDDDADDDARPRLPRNSQSDVPLHPQPEGFLDEIRGAWLRVAARRSARLRDSSRDILDILGSRRRRDGPDDDDDDDRRPLGDITPPSLMF